MPQNEQPHFNLIDQPFIPCVTCDSQRVELGLRDTLVKAHELREIRDGSPLTTLALHRLLLAIVHAAWGDLQTLDDWEAIWQSKRFDEARLDAYFEQWRPRFDLLHPERPFFQAWGWELPADKRKSANELAQEMARGNNATLFDHTTDNPPPRFSIPECARNLIANQTFAAAGGVSATGNRTGAPLVGQVVVMPTGQTLWETLALNLLAAEERPEVLHTLGVPAWEREETTFAEPPIPSGYLDLLTWQPRRIRLHVNGQGDEVRAISYAQGRKLELPDGCFEPMTAYRKERPIEFDTDRSVWRDSEALFSKSGTDTQRPLVLQNLANLIDAGLLPDEFAAGLICSGFKNRQAKVFFWRHDTFPLPLNYVTDEELPARLAQCVGAAEEIAKRLHFAIKDTVTTVLDPGNGKPDPKRRQQMVEALGAERLYWSRLETPFRRLFTELAKLPAEPSRIRQKRVAAWVIEDCKHSAERAFDESAGRLDQTARVLRAVHVGKDSLDGRIGKFLRQQNYWEAYRGEDQE